MIYNVILDYATVLLCFFFLHHPLIFQKHVQEDLIRNATAESTILGIYRTSRRNMQEFLCNVMKKAYWFNVEARLIDVQSSLDTETLW